MKTTLQGGGADHVGAVRRGMMTEVGAIATLGCIDTLPEFHIALRFQCLRFTSMPWRGVQRASLSSMRKRRRVICGKRQQKHHRSCRQCR